jgi:hypothetical protein
MSNDSQRTRSDTKKKSKPILNSVPEREAEGEVHPQTHSSPKNNANTSPNNPYFLLGTSAGVPSRIQGNADNLTDDIEDLFPAATLQRPNGQFARKSTPKFIQTTIPQSLAFSSTVESANIDKQPDARINLEATPKVSTKQLFQMLSSQISSFPTPSPVSAARQHELLIAATLGKNELSKLMDSRALGSQDSQRSQDRPMETFLPHTAQGYLQNAFIKNDSAGTSPSASHSPSVSGGSASQSSYFLSQNSDQFNAINPKRTYDFRSRKSAQQKDKDLRQEFIRQDTEACFNCGRVHFYIDDFCTETHDIHGYNTEALHQSTIAHRLKARELFSLNEPDYTVPEQFAEDDATLYAEFILFKAAKLEAAKETGKFKTSPKSSLSAVLPQSLEQPLDDDDGRLSQRSQQSTHSAQEMATVIASAISQTLASTPSATDIATAMATAIGNSSHHMTTNDPPKITKILDSIHLMTIIWPAYQVYAHQSGTSKCRSLWDLYSHDQKSDVLEFFQKPIVLIDDDTVFTLHRNEEWFNALSNSDFLTAMCKELGYISVIEAESALKDIKFPGSLSDLQSWVKFKASWTLALKQMSSRSRISEKNLSTIFKNSLPSSFWKSNYDQQGHRDWNSGYKWCIQQLSNTDFQSGYNIDAEQQIKSSDIKHLAEIEILKKKILALEAATNSKKENGSAKPESSQTKTKTDAHIKPEATSKPIWEVQGNVNPKWDPNNQRDDNPAKKECSICTAIHKYADEFCTAAKVKGTTTDTPRLSPAILHQRKWDKQELGHYCTKLVTNPSTAPTTIEAHHGKAASTATTLAGGAAKKK